MPRNNLLESLSVEPFVNRIRPTSVMPQPPKPLPPAPGTLVPPTLPAVKTRAFDDSIALREAIYNNALEAARAIQPVNNQRFSLAIENVDYADPGSFSVAQQKKAILESRTLGRRLRGDWVLRTADGQELERKRASLAIVPYLTDRGTFINNGTEYAMTNQLRLRPGVYTRVKKNGLIEAHMNVLRGPSHKIELEPETGVFHFAISQARIPAVNVLRAMGVTPQQMAEAWGPETARANMAKLDPVYNRRLIEKLRIRKTDEESEADAITRTYLNMGIDPEVTRRTLGLDKDTLDADVLLRTTSKLMRVSRQEEDPDDRDAIPFQTVHGPEDIIAERFRKSRGTLHKALWKMSREGKLGSYVSNALNDDVKSALLGSRLGMALEEVNPAELLDQQQRVTRMGVGGIENADAVPVESRSVHPTQVGFIDPLRTAESGQVGVDLRFASSARKGADNKLYAQVRTLDGQTVEKNAGELYDEFVAFPGELQSDKQAIPVVHKGRVISVPRDKVTLEFPPAEHLFSAMANLDTGKAGIKGQRMVMATRMLQQALGLQEGEAPLVRGADADDPTKSYEERYGEKMGAVRTQQAGRVVSVTPEEIVLKQEDGTERRIELYKDFPFNRKTFLTQTPTVKAGDLVTPGQLLARSNYTDSQGVAALGRNLRIAYVPYKGLNWEDAVVVSESAAKKFTSEHMYMHDHEIGKQDRIGKKAYVGIFPSKYSKDTLAKFDDNGAIKPGTVVQPGDPLFLLAQERERDRKSLLRSSKTPFQDKSLVWDQDYEGVVTDVVNTGKNVSVVVKTYKPSQIGDKVTGKYGDKGLISAILPDEDMPQDEQGRPFDILVSPLGLNSRINPTQLVEAALGKVAEKTGKPYNLNDFDAGKDYAEFAFNELKKHGLSDYETIIDPKTGRKIQGVATGNRWFMKLHHMAADKLQGRGLGGYSSDDSPAGKTGQSDGCFTAKQRIVTHLGPLSIASICEKRLSVLVRTFSETSQDWVYRPVTDWFVRRASVNNIISVHTEGGICEKESRTNRTRSVMHLTKNHLVFTYDGRKIPAGQLTSQDCLVTQGPVVTKHQWEFLFGTLLGDGSANSFKVTMEHSLRQVEFVNWKKSVIAGLYPQQCDNLHKEHASRSVWTSCDEVCHRLTTLCYPNGVKTVTQAWLDELSDLSVAVWVLDDGYIGKRVSGTGKIRWGGSIATHGFDPQSRALLSDWLSNRLGVPCPAKDSGEIYLPKDACLKLIDIIATWVPLKAIPKSKKHVREVVAEKQSHLVPHKIDSVCRLGKVPLRISKIVPYVHDRPGVAEVNVYDFTVDETHTYVAGHALVSNSKRLGMLETSALLSSGATEVLREASLIRGQANPEYWSKFMSGYDPTTPEVPFVYDKFVNMLKAAGVNPVRTGPKVQLMALTDKAIDELTGDREIKNSETVNWKNMAPIKDGLFDPAATGGHATTGRGANQWAHVKLHTPLPNPVMEEPIRRVLGLTKPKFEQIMLRQEQLNGRTGPEAISQALAQIDLPKLLEQTKQAVKSNSKTKRDEAIRKLAILSGAEKTGIHPKEWVVSKVPVIPPAFRPVSVMGNKKLPLVDDANYLYKELIDTNNSVKKLAEQLDPDDYADELYGVYKSFKAVAGLGDPQHPKNVERKVRGVLKNIIGPSGPKSGYMQRKLLGSTVDFVSRGVIIPNPDLSMDQVGVPEEKAWSMYTPMVVRRLVRAGLPRLKAIEMVEQKDPRARRELLAEMDNAVVVWNRAPTLHRYGIMAAKPVLVSGKAIEIPPFVFKGMGGDVDGDQVNLHALVTPEARKEALAKMLPSRNLFSVSEFKAHQIPEKDLVTGLLAASQAEENKPEIVFNTVEDAIRAFKQDGSIGLGRRVKILQPMK